MGLTWKEVEAIALDWQSDKNGSGMCGRRHLLGCGMNHGSGFPTIPLKYSMLQSIYPLKTRLLKMLGLHSNSRSFSIFIKEKLHQDINVPQLTEHSHSEWHVVRLLMFRDNTKDSHSYLLNASPVVLLLKSLLLDKLSVAQFLKLPLLLTQVAQLFFLHHFYQSLLNGLADQHLENRLHFNVEVKQLQRSINRQT